MADVAENQRGLYETHHATALDLARAVLRELGDPRLGLVPIARHHGWWGICDDPARPAYRAAKLSFKPGQTASQFEVGLLVEKGTEPTNRNPQIYDELTLQGIMDDAWDWHRFLLAMQEHRFREHVADVGGGSPRCTVEALRTPPQGPKRRIGILNFQVEDGGLIRISDRPSEQPLARAADACDFATLAAGLTAPFRHREWTWIDFWIWVPVRSLSAEPTSEVAQCAFERLVSGVVEPLEQLRGLVRGFNRAGG